MYAFSLSGSHIAVHVHGRRVRLLNVSITKYKRSQKKLCLRLSQTKFFVKAKTCYCLNSWFDWLTVSGALQQPPIQPIVGGQEALKDEYPWQILLKYDDRLRCSGSILNELTILTTAYCVDSDPSQRYSICITKTPLFKYTENFYHEKLKIFRKKILIFFIFLLRTWIVGTL